ncbi:MAG TPA: HD domain-containing phosphohydrolase [Candidatus Dormibacteraeota bacterium]|nr:HD domain-containing phosphohydrolase [Candidatus Dormibacteraeota bacterium]
MTTPRPSSLQLHRTTLKVAAVSFWGLATIVMATDYLGSGLQVNYPTEWVVTVLACAAGVVCWTLPWAEIPARWFVPVVFAGIAMLTVGVFATGGTHSHLPVLYLVIVVFTASILEFQTAISVLITAILAAALPLLIRGWDSYYARSVVLLAASMVICAYIPALVRKALRAENQLAEQRRLELEESYLSTIEALAAALDAKDRHTEEHSRETAALARAVGQRLGLAEETLRFLEYSALLHDIGKIGVPGYILNKPGPLDDEETAIMREHPVIGERIVASVPFLARIRPIVRAEHERWDGGGYPDGLSGESIPIEARIIHACDAFQAMASDRPYRPARPRDWILKEIRAQAGLQFDPRVAQALLEVIEAGEVAVAGTAESALHEDRKLPVAHSWTQHLDAIQQLGAGLAKASSVPGICETIGRAITTLLPYDQCRIYLLEDDGHTLRPVYFSDTMRGEYEGVTAETLAVQVGQGITGWVAETKQGALVGDTERHPKAVHIPGTTETDESMLALPVIFEDNLIGIIVNVKVGLHQYTGDHLRLMTILANQAAVSIFNARLIERLAATARTDPLTGLANRRAFELALEQRLAAESPEPFSVIMLDVDGLKQVNDARGHAAGDAVLKRVASVLTSNLRSVDVVTRWGGDEFVLLMPVTDRVGAVSLARRIGGTLRGSDDAAGPISVSIGTASFPADGTTADSLLGAADHSMYADKRQRVA